MNPNQLKQLILQRTQKAEQSIHVCLLPAEIECLMLKYNFKINWISHFHQSVTLSAAAILQKARQGLSKHQVLFLDAQNGIKPLPYCFQ